MSGEVQDREAVVGLSVGVLWGFGPTNHSQPVLNSKPWKGNALSQDNAPSITLGPHILKHGQVVPQVELLIGLWSPQTRSSSSP